MSLVIPFRGSPSESDCGWKQSNTGDYNPLFGKAHMLHKVPGRVLYVEKCRVRRDM